VREDLRAVGVPENFPVPEYPVIGKIFLKKAGGWIFLFRHNYTVELSIGVIRLKNDRFIRNINPFASIGVPYNQGLFFKKTDN
jgi:hypothetical protein